MSDKVIYKYRIPFDDDVSVDMPKDAQIVKFGIQGIDANNRPKVFAWALVNLPIETTEPRLFVIRGTGHPLHDFCVVSENDVPTNTPKFVYKDSLFDRAFVWHIFEGINVFNF